MSIQLSVSLDGSFGRQSDKDQKREQGVAIFDLLDNNSFAPVGHDGGPHRLCLALAGQAAGHDRHHPERGASPLSPFVAYLLPPAA
ncbi:MULTISPECIES: UPF0262 family protein [Rhizobium]|uniref:UPF0262 family protein n=1 Tax=Rhizobium TaxID=379 RepID=UPI00287F7A97|nr:UPF0262 family protein [Rhizobium bangladeshense]